MINAPAVGFTAILAVVGLGVDYYQQTLNSGSELGELSAGAYIESISGRFASMKPVKVEQAEQAEPETRRQAGARAFLPEAPNGWVRRAWLDGDNSRISMPEREMEDFEKEVIDANAFLKMMMNKGKKQSEEPLNAEIWVYERGEEVVSVRARYVQEMKGNSMLANSSKILMGNMGAFEGWAVIQGVAFGMQKSLNLETAPPYLRLFANIGFGDEVALNVRSTASEDAIREILNAIDYDGLNSLLPEPSDQIGSNATAVELALEKPLAQSMIEQRKEHLKRRTRTAEAKLINNAESNAEIIRALQDIGLPVEDALQTADQQQEEEGGMLNAIAGFFKSDRKDAADTAKPLQVEQDSKIITTCSTEGAFKRCRIGG